MGASGGVIKVYAKFHLSFKVILPIPLTLLIKKLTIIQF